MQMDYFRRPQIVGKALQRLDVGTVRGSKRRLDPDISSAVPYFAGVSTGQTVTLDVNGTPLSVPFSGVTPTYQSILSDLNTALGIIGQAKDADGTIEVSTLTPGGYVQVTGGTGSKAVGFDVARHRIRSAGGDLRSTPEHRVGNPFGASFPIKGEDLGSEPFNRALGRVASNLDVLFSEHVRESTAITKIAAGSTVVTRPDVNTTLIALPALTRVFTGLNHFNATPDISELAPFFTLIDPVTGLPPATCRVIDVVRGAVGSPPYTDAVTFAGAGSVVNVDLVKAAGTINSITDGRVVGSTASNFLTNGSVVGDWVKILGATNVAPWTNNGYRWVIEEVIDATHVALRPMSKSELAQANPVPAFTEEQPVIDLNDRLAGIEVYGTFEVRTGTWTPGVKLVVQPPLPAGASYDVWVAQPTSLRSVNAGTLKTGDYPTAADFVSQRGAVPNGIISGFRITGGGTSRTIGEGYVRMHGKILRIPAAVYTAAGLGNGTWFVYFDEADGRVKTSSALPALAFAEHDPETFVPAIRPLARFVVSGGTTFNEENTLAQYNPFSVETLTVGVGGQFSEFKDACDFVNAWAASYSENTDDVVANRIHFEIVVLSSNDADNDPIVVRCPSLSIRGVNPRVDLGFPTSFTLTDCYELKIEDLLISHDDERPLILLNGQTQASKGVNITLRNVSNRLGSAANSHIVQATTSEKVRKLVIENCHFKVTQGISWANSLTLNDRQEVSIRSSWFEGINCSTTTRLLRGGSVSSWVGLGMSVVGCKFTGFGLTGASNLGLFTFVSGSDGNLTFSDNYVSAGSFDAASDILWIDMGSSSAVNLHVTNNYFTGMPRLVDATLTSPTFEVSGNFAGNLRPEAGNSAVRCGRAFNNIFSANAPPTTLGILLETITAIGNRIIGIALKGIFSDSLEAVIQGNYVDVSVDTFGTQAASAIEVTNFRPKIIGNWAKLGTDTECFSVLGAALRVGNSDDGAVVSGNVLYGEGGYCMAATHTAARGTLTGNIFKSTGWSSSTWTTLFLQDNWEVVSCVFDSTIPAVYTNVSDLQLLMSMCSLAGDVFDPASTVPSTLRIDGCRIVGDLGLASLASTVVLGINDTSIDGTASLNAQRSDVTSSAFGGAIAAGITRGTFIGNRVAGAYTSTLIAGKTRMEGNEFGSSLTLDAGAIAVASSLILSGNHVVGAFALTLNDAIQTFLGEGNDFLAGADLDVGAGFSRVFSNNSVVGGAFNVDGGIVIGNYVDASVGGAGTITHAIQNCRAEGNFFKSLGATSLVTFVSCHAVGNDTEGGSTFGTSIKDSSFLSSRVTGKLVCDLGSLFTMVSDNKITGVVTLTTTASGAYLMFSGNITENNITLGTGSSSRITVVGNHTLGSMTFQPGNASNATLSGNRIASSLLCTAAGSCNIAVSGNVFVGALMSSSASGDSVTYVGNVNSGGLTVAVARFLMSASRETSLLITNTSTDAGVVFSAADCVFTSSVTELSDSGLTGSRAFTGCSFQNNLNLSRSTTLVDSTTILDISGCTFSGGTQLFALGFGRVNITGVITVSYEIKVQFADYVHVCDTETDLLTIGSNSVEGRIHRKAVISSCIANRLSLFALNGVVTGNSLGQDRESGVLQETSPLQVSAPTDAKDPGNPYGEFLVDGNRVYITNRDDTTAAGFAIDVDDVQRITISNNHIMCANHRGSSHKPASGIRIGRNTGVAVRIAFVTISGNTIILTQIAAAATVSPGASYRAVAIRPYVGIYHMAIMSNHIIIPDQQTGSDLPNLGAHRVTYYWYYHFTNFNDSSSFNTVMAGNVLQFVEFQDGADNQAFSSGATLPSTYQSGATALATNFTSTNVNIGGYDATFRPTLVAGQFPRMPIPDTDNDALAPDTVPV